jgi:hypothetical protein
VRAHSTSASDRSVEPLPNPGMKTDHEFMGLQFGLHARSLVIQSASQPPSDLHETKGTGETGMGGVDTASAALYELSLRKHSSNLVLKPACDGYANAIV